MVVKKKGSSLIFVVIIFMFVTIISSSMLSMVSSNYKARVSESNRIKNLYGADSGINTAYVIITKTFEAATQYGYLKVNELYNMYENENIDINTNRGKYVTLINDIDELESDIKNLQNQIKDVDENKDTLKFKQQISEKRKLIEEDKEFIELIKKEEFKRAFKEYINTNLKNFTEDGSYIQYIKENYSDTYMAQNISIGYDNNQKIESEILEQEIDRIKYEKEISKSNGHKYDIKLQYYDKEKPYNIKLISTFYDRTNKKEDNENGFSNVKNKRQLQASYIMNVPNFDDIYFEKVSEDIYENSFFNDKGITVGRDFIINNVSNLTVDGDIFVVGVKPSTMNINNKYNGGISLKDSKNVKFNGDVVTRSTFNIQDNSSVEIKNNLYASNIYAGAINKDGSIISNSNLNVYNNVVLDNDLTLNGYNTQIKINNFYGINDKNINSEYSDQSKNSSSIIINNYDDDSKITINNEAYIMGTAYINTENKYQTGESVAVKGNYKAYSVEDPDKANQQFEEDDPLRVLKGSLKEKVDHFVKYWSKEENKEGLLSEVIKLPSEVHSVGATVSEGNINNSTNYDSEIIKTKKAEYAARVYKLDNVEINEENKDDYYSYYNNEDIINIEQIINLSNLDGYNIESEANKDYKALFDNSKKIMEIKSGNNDEIEITDKKIKITAKDGELNAVIVTNGDIIIDDNITINGNIITTDNLNIEGSNVKIKEDKNVKDKVIESKSDLFKEIFGVMTSEEITQNEATQNILNSQYNIDDFVKINRWKILK
ncbi:hypothetical protein [uncultured Clostridium sp.]|uniref:hypothetical protein n=1 Tax=uncultured Clostridium sp. TaxID=59620 RepID=UPI0027DE2A5F|nr:hypothetical protein [uncultured Clostridium sp.]